MKIFSRIVLGLVFCGLLLASLPARAETDKDVPPILSKAKQNIVRSLTQIDQDLALAAQKIAQVDANGPATRKILAALYVKNNFAVDCSFVTPQGRLLMVEPPAMRKYERMDVSKQDHMLTLHKQHKPVFSPVFRSVEGIDAMDFAYPVMKNNKFIGSISMLVKPQSLLGRVIGPVIKNSKVEIWAMQPDGRLVFDLDDSQIGLNLFTAKLYAPFPKVKVIAQKIAKDPQGRGSYEFYSHRTKKLVTKDAYWDTIAFHGMEWRLVGTLPRQ